MNNPATLSATNRFKFPSTLFKFSVLQPCDKEELDTDFAHEPIVKVRLQLQGYVFSLLFRLQHGLPGVVCRMSNLIKLFALFFYRTQLDKCRKWSSIRTRISQEDPTVSIFFQFANSFGRENIFFRGEVTRQETKQNNFFRISSSRIVQGDPAVIIFCQFSNFLGAKTMFFFHL